MNITSVNINWFSCSRGFVSWKKKNTIGLGWTYNKDTNIYKKTLITIFFLLLFAVVFPIQGNKNCKSNVYGLILWSRGENKIKKHMGFYWGRGSLKCGGGLLDCFGPMESINVACVLQEAEDAHSRACTRSQL